MADTLRILEPESIHRLIPPNYSNPYRNTTLRILDSESIINTGQDYKYTTLSGTVVDSQGNPLKRNLKVYNGNGLTNLVATTISTSNGIFSCTVPGTTSDDFCVVVLGETGECNAILSSIKGAP